MKLLPDTPALGARLRAHRYVILAEGEFEPQSAKTAISAIRYLPERVAAVIDSRHAGQSVHEVLGFGGEIPVVASLEAGLAFRPNALLIGIAPQGGRLPESWRAVLRAALRAGLDLVSGLHVYLADDPELAALAAEQGAAIYDLRRDPGDLPVSTGLARQVAARRVLTVGSDCNIGKMTTALQLRDALVRRGVRTGFAATGQTGILIEGWGVAVDAVKADFIAGAAERLVLQAAEGNDLVLVEGQGSLIHPGYSGVTLGLLHGSLPDAMVLCHQPSRRCIYGGGGAYDWVPIPSLPELVEIYEGALRPLRPAKVVAICLNTHNLDEAAAHAAIARAAAETGLPATDPVRFDPAPVVTAMLNYE